ncbi:MAG: orotidine-5'-phosphate decarboxylase [Phycisphaerales bacterium]|nr:MAG: orotidine-5'-phosphate decarboxylase [Phycisphaerales bacterium]
MARLGKGVGAPARGDAQEHRPLRDGRRPRPARRHGARLRRRRGCAPAGGRRPVTHAEPFADKLRHAVASCAGAPVCVGLDPVFERLPPRLGADAPDPVAAIERFCVGVIEATVGVAGVVKAQSACFERYGGAGFDALRRVRDAAGAHGALFILDAKRGDIGVSAEHYAAMAFGALDADALTVNAYMGADTVGPYLDAARWGRRGVFVLVRPRHPRRPAQQTARLDSRATLAPPLARAVAALGAGRLGACGYSDVGAVVAATKPGDAADLRARMKEQVFLVPGFGAQGGDAASVRALFDAAGFGAVVTASRSVIYPRLDAGESWRDGVRRAAGEFARTVSSAAGVA